MDDLSKEQKQIAGIFYAAYRRTFADGIPNVLTKAVARQYRDAIIEICRTEVQGTYVAKSLLRHIGHMSLNDLADVIRSFNRLEQAN